MSWPYRRRSRSRGEFPMWWPWLRSLMNTPMTGFTFVKGQFFQSKVFPLLPLVLNCVIYYVMCCFLTVQVFSTRPSYRKRKASNSTEFSVRTNVSVKGGEYPNASSEAPAMLVPTLAPARSVRDAIQEVKMVQVRFSPSLNSSYSLSYFHKSYQDKELIYFTDCPLRAKFFIVTES